MTTRERNIIKEIRPLIDAGRRGRIMEIYQNLTTRRNKAPKCKQCGGPIIKKGGKAQYGKAKFCTMLCFQIAKRTIGLTQAISI